VNVARKRESARELEIQILVISSYLFLFNYDANVRGREKKINRPSVFVKINKIYFFFLLLFLAKWSSSKIFPLSGTTIYSLSLSLHQDLIVAIKDIGHDIEERKDNKMLVKGQLIVHLLK